MADKTLESISSSQIMPVIRATSFDKKLNKGVPFIYDEHTAETAVLLCSRFRKIISSN